MSKTINEDDCTGELEQVIRQSAKERLLLERYFAYSCFQMNQSLRTEFDKLKQLEKKNGELLTELTSFLQESKVRERPNGKERKLNSTEDEKSLNEHDFNIHLTELEQLSREHMLLKSTLLQVERECRAAKQQVSDLQKKLQTLETELEHVKLSSANPHSSCNTRTDSLNFHKCILEHASEMMGDGPSQCRADVECSYEKSISGLQTKLYELEKKYEMQVLRHEQLMRDMFQLRQQATNPGSTTGPHAIISDHLPYSSSAEASALTLEEPQFDVGMAKTVKITPCLVQTKPSSFQVFVAKYNYDPVHHSPNENPEAELMLTAGDYIFIYGDIDEDGFYDGELMNGKRGLVPSNFIERVPDKDLQDFPGSSLGDTESDSIKNTSYSSSGVSATDFDESHFLHGPKANIEDDLEDILEVDEENTSVDNSDVIVTEQPDPAVQDIPFPLELVVERQLLNSLLISWSAPPSQSMSTFPVQSYSIYLDGLLKASVKAKDRTKALLEKVDLTRPHQISVRALTSQGQSKDQQCLISVGKGITAMPSDFQVSHITSMSAVISWTPSNSNWEHVVHVNNHNRTVMKPGSYRCLITGLACDMRHTVSVQPLLDSEPHVLRLTNSFRTLPSEIPDAPADVQVEAGPKQGTLLVMWLPIKPDGKPPNSAVTGYSVYVDGRRVKDLPSPTGDHVLLESDDFSSVLDPKQITIRATTATKESEDSSPISLTPQLLSEVKQLVDPVVSATQFFQEQKLVANMNTAPVAEVSLQAETSTIQPLKQSEVSLPPGYTSPQWPSSVASDAEPAGHQGRDISRLVGPGLTESGFSAQQLSPLEMKFSAEQEEEEVRESFNGYEIQNSPNTRKKMLARTTQSTGLGPPPYGPLPLIEVTKDNSSSFSDSSFDVDVDEPMERRRSGNSQNCIRSNTVAHHRSVSADFSQQPASSGRKTDHSKLHSAGRHGQKLANMFGNGYEEEDTGARRTEHSQQGNSVSSSSEVRGKTVNSKPRIFIALFNYDPATMSPNPDGIDEELPFKEGQLIKIIRDKDSDGFYLGEAGGLCGLVPSNMISEIDDPAVATHLLQDHESSVASRVFSGTGAGAGTGIPAELDSTTKTVAPSGKHRHSKQSNKTQRLESVDLSSAYHINSPPRRMIALYSYDIQHKSGEVNREGELSFKAGEVIMAYGEPDKNGFLCVERNGCHGVVPPGYLRDLSPGETSSTEKRSRHSSGHGGRESDDQHGVKQGQTIHDKMTKSHKHHRTREDPQQVEAQSQKGPEQMTMIGDIRNQARQHNQVYSTKDLAQ